MLKRIDKNEYILALDSIPEFNTFLSMAKIESGRFAAEVMWKIYRAIFSNDNQKYLYVNYYKVEYDTFEKYFFKKFGFNIDAALSDKNIIYYFSTELYDVPLIDESYGESYFQHFIKVIDNEN